MTVLDATFGAGGHSTAVAKVIGKKGALISLDADKNVFSDEKVDELGRLTTFTPIVVNFRNVTEALKHIKVDAALFDLGLSSTQLEESGRGFSFQKDEQLAMTFKAEPEEGDVTAQVVLNDWSEETLAVIFKGFGEERFARRIAKSIVEARKVTYIDGTKQLVDIILASTPVWYHRGRTHPATRVFQALRMAVNDELGSIEQGLTGALECMNPGGRLAVISFHSIEDRKVKHLFKEFVEEGSAKAVTKKPIIPDDEELAQNPRARSAKLRIVERV
jgi:16S rRNA (cytosine1402-N4)-methyltransferase